MMRPNKFVVDLVLATCLALGFAVFVMACFAAGATWRHTYGHYGYEVFGVDLDNGEPYFQTYYRGKQRYLNAERKPIPKPSTLSNGFHLSSHRNYFGQRLSSTMRPLPWSQRIAGFNAPNEEFWYFVRSSNGRTGYLIGYSEFGSRQLGYIGNEGFQSELPTAESCFPLSDDFVGHTHMTTTHGVLIGYGPSLAGHYSPNTTEFRLATSDRVVRINLEDRSVETLFEMPGIRSLRSDNESIVVRTDKLVRWFDTAGEVLFTCAIPSEVNNEVLTFWPLSQDKVLISVQPTYGEHQLHSYVASDGEDRATPIQPQRGADLKLANRASFGFAEGVAFSAFFPTMVWISARSIIQTLSFWSYLGLFPLPLVVAAMTWRISKGGNQPRWAWALFGLLLGIPGLLGYWVLKREKLPEISCGSCQKKVRRQRTSCGSCGEMIPLPPRIGTEIFA